MIEPEAPVGGGEGGAAATGGPMSKADRSVGQWLASARDATADHAVRPWQPAPWVNERSTSHGVAPVSARLRSYELWERASLMNWLDQPPLERTPEELQTHLEAMGFVSLGQFWRFKGFSDPTRVVHDVFGADSEATWCEVALGPGEALALVTLLEGGGAVVTSLGTELFPGQPQGAVRLFVADSDLFADFFTAHRQNVVRSCTGQLRPLALPITRDTFERAQLWLVQRELLWQRLIFRRQARLFTLGVVGLAAWALALHLAVSAGLRLELLLLSTIGLGVALTVLAFAANTRLTRADQRRLDNVSRSSFDIVRRPAPVRAQEGTGGAGTSG